MEQANVLQVVTTLARGGAQFTALRAAHLLREDHLIEATIVAGPDVDEEGDLRREAASLDIHLELAPHLHRRIRPIDDVMAVVELVRLIRSHNPAIVHTHSSKAGVVGRLAAWVTSTPAIHTVHGWSFHAGMSPVSRWIVVLLERLLARKTFALVVVTDTDRAIGVRHRIAATDRFRVVRSGIDLTAFTTVTQAPRRATPVVGTVCRLVAQKDPMSLIEVFRAVAERDPNVEFVVHGDGPLRAAAEQRCSSVGLSERVTFSGVTDDVPSALAAMDVFVLTSRWEGLPRSIVEAMSCGTPVASWDVGGVGEIVVHDETGLLVERGDIQGLADAVHNLLLQPERAAVLVANARARVSAFDERTMAAHLARLYREAADTRNRPRRWRAAAIGRNAAGIDER